MNALAPIFLPISMLLFAPTGDREGWFAQKDADNSGTISASEAEGTRLADHFAKLDTNKDGQLSKAELKAGRKGHKDHKRGAMAQRLKKLDKNGDGAWTKAEVAGTPLEKAFARIDADKNGKITRAELKAAHPHAKGRGGGKTGEKLRSLDKNGDGAWTKAELAGSPLAKHFDKIDGNKDGKITKAELASMHEQRKGGRRDGKPRSMKQMGKADGKRSARLTGANPNARKQG
jgi:Ca2+-binding EF-hand superfamily protein